MALPTLTNHWTRKNIYEQAIVTRRNKELDFREKWSDTAGYFRKAEVEMSKQNCWTSDQSFQNSMDAYKAVFESENKVVKLKRRRLKLADMLEKERLEFEAELKGLSKDNVDNLEDMRERAEGLKSAREEKQQQTAREKLYDHWRQNNPDLRKMEQDQFRGHVIDTWTGQVELKKEQIESARREKEFYEQKMEEERQAALRVAQRREEEKLEEEKQLKLILHEQMHELRKREAEATQMKKQQEKLMRQQWEIEQMEEQRQFFEQRRQQQEHGRILLRQHVAHMRRKSKQIQEELELDRKILESLIEKEQQVKAVHTARRDKARADAAWMKQVIEDQIRLEKSREAELDMLYQDEAARVWQKREAEWAKERLARQKLMKEVLEGRQQQIEEHMEDLRVQQEDSLNRREQLIREMEVANQMTHREQEQAEALKTTRKEELKEQILTRREEEEANQLRLQLEEEEERVEEEDYEEVLRQEAQRLQLHAYTPKSYGRKQAWT